jgi:hypothetical protein
MDDLLQQLGTTRRHAPWCPTAPCICCDRTVKRTDVYVMRGNVRRVPAGFGRLPTLQRLEVPYK